jgi:hypothetical protein
MPLARKAVTFAANRRERAVTAGPAGEVLTMAGVHLSEQ